MFAFADRRDRVEVAFTDRLGGVSPGPCGALDLSLDRSQDDLHENLTLISRALDYQVAPRIQLMRQVHSAQVVEVTECVEGPLTPRADVLVTAAAGLALAARAADCVPVVLGDAHAGIVAAVHSGREGVRLDVVGVAVETLARQGAQDIAAWVGPAVCGSCYEVPHSMRAELSALWPEAESTTTWGTPALDLRAAVLAQLSARSEVVEIVNVAVCTQEDENFHSHRRDGNKSGRHAGLVWLRP